MSTFHVPKKVSSFRKIAACMWKAPNDPTIYGMLDIDATNLLSYIEEVRARHGAKITVTHVVAQAVAHSLRELPKANGKVRWGKILLRDSVDIFLQVATDDGRDLSGVKITGADRLTLEEISVQLGKKARQIREGRDPAMQKSRSLFQRLPVWLLRPLLRISDFLVNTLSFDLTSRGMPRDPFGSAMVTSVGMFGIDMGFAPFVPIARCPMIIMVNQVAKRPWVVDDEVVARPVLRLSGTFDHRLIDGFLAGKFGGYLRKNLTEPERMETAVDSGAKRTGATS